MKRILPWIILLIGLSLVGIIGIQVSWINNMILLRQEQIKHSVEEATIWVGNDLVALKSSSTGARPFWEDDFLSRILRPPTIGKQVTAEEVEKKFQQAFRKYHLPERMRFEFGIASLEAADENAFEKISPNFIQTYMDTTHNFTFNWVLQSGSSTLGGTGIEEVLFVVIPDLRSLVLQSLWWRITISVIFTLVIMTAFYVTVRTMVRQKKLVEIKNDFINNMTHEFKTPIATISLAVDALRNEKVKSDPERMNYFNSIIKEENLRMNRQVETILRASQLERQDFEVAFTPVHVHPLIQRVADTFSLQIDSRAGSLVLRLDAAQDLLQADESHLSNLLSNLIDNALKYCKEDVPPSVEIVTKNESGQWVMSIRDNGIGMSRDTLKRIYEKFYRAHTGNVHNVKGFGLGLSYVKTLVDAHRGSIEAESTLGKGSCFTLRFPLAKA
ncbi:MAG: HAMP domain-containing histidine kinase [Bacteroidetes bacterium]|nr:HAMP domain-containing histidine kinase [Bacteroidota bacterium]